MRFNFIQLRHIFLILLLGFAVASCDKTDLAVSDEDTETETTPGEEEEEEEDKDGDIEIEVEVEKEEEPEEESSEPTELYMYISILKSYNSNIYQDVTFNVSYDDLNTTFAQSLSSSTTEFILTFTTNAEDVFVGSTEIISNESLVDLSGETIFTLVADNGATVGTFTLNLTISEDSTTPHIYIDVANGAEITSKDYYLDAVISISGGSDYDDLVDTDATVKGRGNSTWGYAKKPYKIKFNSKTPVLGLEKEKDWVLLANYQDPTLMLNPLAMKIGDLFDIPYANHMIATDLTINGTYRGSYTLTEQIEIKEARVNLSDDGYILELDTYFDEDYKEYSALLRLPVMLKDGNVDSQSDFDAIMDEFNEMEAIIMDSNFPDNDYKDIIDIESVAAFILTNQMMLNMEVSRHPKSFYLHKDKDAKFFLGPIWDFDWVCGYETGGYFSSVTLDLLSYYSTASPSKFLNQFFKDPEFVAVYKAKWEQFENNTQEFYDYAESYKNFLSPSFEKNAVKWSTGVNLESKYTTMMAWFKERVTVVAKLVDQY